MPSRYLFADPEALRGRPWHDVEQKIVTGLADHFSFFIDGIRRYAPGTIIDLECGDSRVFEILLKRHENLGVMYMSYGSMPRVKESMDLYESMAKHQLKAERIVLETDCYYTAKYHQQELLYRDSCESMFPAHELDLMQAKHQALVSRDVAATWSWGLNICHFPAKFDAVCQGLREPHVLTGCPV